MQNTKLHFFMTIFLPLPPVLLCAWHLFTESLKCEVAKFLFGVGRSTTKKQPTRALTQAITITSDLCPHPPVDKIRSKVYILSDPVSWMHGGGETTFVVAPHFAAPTRQLQLVRNFYSAAPNVLATGSWHASVVKHRYSAAPDVLATGLLMLPWFKAGIAALIMSSTLGLRMLHIPPGGRWVDVFGILHGLEFTVIDLTYLERADITKAVELFEQDALERIALKTHIISFIRFVHEANKVSAQPPVQTTWCLTFLVPQVAFFSSPITLTFMLVSR
jgi:hypothetical protein